MKDYMTPEQRAERERQLHEFHIAACQDNWATGEAGKLCDELYKAYTAYEEYLKRNYSARYQSNYVETTSQHLYLRLRENLAKARVAERCSHLKSNGQRCGSPRMKDNTLCYAHARMAESRPRKLGLPSMEDPNGVQMAIMKLAQWLIDDEVDQKKAAMIAYLIQTAANNVGKVDFEVEEVA
jgi:hypothetical protein